MGYIETSPLQAGGSSVNPWALAGGTTVDPDGASDGADPWEGATPLDPPGATSIVSLYDFMKDRGPTFAPANVITLQT